MKEIRWDKEFRLPHRVKMRISQLRNYKYESTLNNNAIGLTMFAPDSRIQRVVKSHKRSIK